MALCDHSVRPGAPHLERDRFRLRQDGAYVGVALSSAQAAITNSRSSRRAGVS